MTSPPGFLRYPLSPLSVHFSDTMHAHDRKPIACALAAAMLVGLSAPLAKILLAEIEPVTLASLFYLGSGLGVVCIGTVQAAFGRDRRQTESALQASDIPWLLCMIAFGGVLAPVVLMFSLETLNAATAAVLLNFEAVATTLLAALIFSEPVGRRIWVAMGCITAACLLLSWDPAAAFGISLPALGILATCVLWGLDNNFGQRLSGRDPLQAIAVKGMGAGIVTLCIALMLGEHPPDPLTGCVAMLFGFISYGGLVSVFFLLALRGIGTARAGSLLAIAPLFGVLVSLAAFADLPDMLFCAAAPVMAVGVWLLVSEDHTHAHRHPAEVHAHRHRHDDLHHDHEHAPGDPPLSANGEHAHTHRHDEAVHTHPHRPDIHHRHTHR